MLPNGDWREIGSFKIWIPEGKIYDPEAVIYNVSEATTQTVVGARFSRWRFKRWFGADRSFDEQLLYEGINRLQTLSFVGFQAQQDGAPLEKDCC